MLIHLSPPLKGVKLKWGSMFESQHLHCDQNELRDCGSATARYTQVGKNQIQQLLYSYKMSLRKIQNTE